MKTQFKRLYFQGSDTPEANTLFSQTTEQTYKLAEAATSWETFLSETRKLYKAAGFEEVQP